MPIYHFGGTALRWADIEDAFKELNVELNGTKRGSSFWTELEDDTQAEQLFGKINSLHFRQVRSQK